jgi:hypothetical protein
MPHHIHDQVGAMLGAAQPANHIDEGALFGLRLSLARARQMAVKHGTQYCN